MNKGKKVISVIVLILVVLSLSACNSTNSGKSSGEMFNSTAFSGGPGGSGEPGGPGGPGGPDGPGGPGENGSVPPDKPGIDPVNPDNSNSPSGGGDVQVNLEGISANLSKYDTDDSDNPEGAVRITLETNSATFSGEGAVYSDGQLLIRKAGNYYITGTLSEGQIRIKVGDTEKVKLILAGVSLSNSKDGCIYAESGDKVVLTLAAGTVNVLKDTDSSVKNDADQRAPAALYGCCSLTVNGKGTLKVSSSYNNAIGTKKTLKIVGGIIDVTAENNGLKGNNAVVITGGEIRANVKGDGIKTEETENSEKGYVYISGGKLNVTAVSDGINGSLCVYFVGGETEITTTGTTVSTGSTGTGTGGFRPGGWGGSSSNPPDSKGIKAGNVLKIAGGSVTVSSTGHSVHSAGNVYVSDGQLVTTSSKGKGIQAHGDLYISGGSVKVTKATEGLESKGNLYISGGETDIYATDDGINVASSNKALYIEGGKLLVKVSSGDTDGIDSNGSIYITGGETVVLYGSATGSSMASAMDCDGSISVKGGTVVCFGGSGIYPKQSASTNLFKELKCTLPSGTYELRDEAGTVLWTCTVSGTSPSSYSEMWISSDQTKEGQKYTLYRDGTAVTSFTQDALTGATGGGGGGGRPGRW